MSRRISLNGDDWLFKDFYGEDWRWRGAHLPDSRDRRHWRRGSVPGCPHHDLWRLGEIPDPYVERNSLLMEWIPQRTWLYKKSFRVDRQDQGKRIHLHFEGVDYQAEFFLNGRSLGSHTGMFVPVVFDVTDLLHFDAENLLAVVIEPAPMEQPQVSRTSRVHTIKPRMNYWWDFCPRMVHVGIWEDVFLEITGPVRITDVFVRPQLSADFRQADVRVHTELDSPVPDVVEVEISLLYGGCEIARERTQQAAGAGRTHLESCFTLTSPRLWWPNGCGQPELYEAQVRILADGEPSALRSISFGIRRIELEPNESARADARPYTIRVNGRRVYARGWNWVPMDVMYSVPQPARLERLLTLAKDAHVNLLRVWGGGLIETESFYQLCDRLGIMVWQEFTQSSSGIENLPSASPEFVQLWTQTAEAIIPRKRNHPSLAIWCGGNELTGEGERPLDDSHPVLAALKQVVARRDPDRLWLPTSPSGPVFGNSLETIARDPDGLHDVHGPWEYQGVRGQYALYNRGTSLLHSEFGVEGITNLRTLQGTIHPDHQWPVDLDNPQWFHRGAWWVKRPTWDATFGEIHDIETMVRATQFMQADGLRYALESDRRRKYHNSGTLPWQFNEPYPMAACTSAVDYYARPKPAYYAVGRAYQPLLISARFDTLAWEGCEMFEAKAWVGNAHERAYENVLLRMRLLAPEGKTWAEESKMVSFEANRATRLGQIRVPLTGLPHDVFFLDMQLLDTEGGSLSVNRYVFSRAANLAPFLTLPPTELSVTSSDGAVVVTNRGGVVAMFVWLEDARDPRAPGYAYFEDNFFCLFPGERRSVNVTWKDVPAGDRRLEISAWNTRSVIVLEGDF